MVWTEGSVPQEWKEGSVPQEWKDALVKGDFFQCDDWRGISLLDVVGKLFALKQRLQTVAERVLPLSVWY